MRVALALPYIFAIQSDGVRAKREKHMCQVKSGEILFCVYLVISYSLQISVEDLKEKVALGLWNVATIGLSIILCVSLHRLHKLEEISSDVLCDKKTIRRHQRAFLAAASIGLLSYSLSFAPDDDYKLHTTKNITDIASLLSWNVVQFLILTVFVRYGRPLVDDD